MAGAGPAAPPKQPASNGIDNVWRAGPFTNTPGTTHDVVVFNANRLNAGSAIASIAVLSNGIDSAGAPANTAFTAIFSTVQRPLRGGSSARHSSGNRADATRYSRTRSSVGGTSGRPSPQPASVASFWKATGSSSTSRRPLDSQSSSHPSGPQSTRPAISLCSWLIALLPHSEGLEQPRPVRAGAGQLACPLVEHPLERRPRSIGADPHDAAGEIAGVGSRVGIDVGRRCGRVENRDSCHFPPPLGGSDRRRVP